MITRSEGKISTSVYRKPTSTCVTLHFDSNHSFSTKFSIACAMFRRAYNYCSDKNLLDSEIKTINDILLKSCYPIKFIKKAHYRVKFPPPKKAPEQFAATIVIPYVQGKSENISQISSKFARVRVAFSNKNTIRRLLMQVKPKSAPALRNCIYCVPCADCQCIYIGQTKRHVPNRLKEHDDSCYRAFDPSKCDASGYLLAKHAHENGHKFDWANASAIKIERNYFMRLVLEAAAILSHDNVISQPSHQIDKIWIPFFKQEGPKAFSRKYMIPDCISTRVRRPRRVITN
jgi:hypothetical protein